MAQRLGTWLFGGEAEETRTIAWLTSTLGILSGYALYILWWEQEEQGKSGWRFVLALAAAAGMSFTFEVLRSAIEGSTHAWSRSRVVSTVVMLAAFELFIIASHGAAGLDRDTFVGVAGFIFGEQFADKVGPGWNLLALGLLWVVVALTIVAKLRKFILGWPYPDSNPQPGESLAKYLSDMGPDLLRGIWAGIRAGVFWGAVSAIAYVFVFRAYFLAQWIHGNYPAWQESLSSGRSFGLLFLVLYGPLLFAGWCAKHVGGIGLFVGIALVTGVARGMASEGKRRLATYWPVATMVLLLGSPILADPGARRDLAYLAYLSAVTWGIPATLLGALAPLLRRPAHNRSVWGLVACAAAGVIMAVTAARFHSGAVHTEKALLIGATAALLLLAFEFFRGAWSEEFWLCVALSIGTIVWGTTTLMHEVNLFDMQKRAHTLIALPLGVHLQSGGTADQMAMLPFLLSRQPAHLLLEPFGDTVLGLLPYGVNQAAFIFAPCAEARGFTPEQRTTFANNLTRAAASDRATARSADALAQDAAQRLERFEQSRRAALDRARTPLAGPPGAQISEVRARLSELAQLDETIRKWEDWAGKKSSAIYIGQGQRTLCQTDLDALVADLGRAREEKKAAESKLAETKTRVGRQMPAYTAELAEARKNLEPMRDRLQLAQAQHLELTMTSSLGFWVTIGLLAIWRLTQPEPD